MRIDRGNDPGPFSQPRDYVSHLRVLFRFRCAFCLTPDDRLGGEEGMKVDHFLPESRFEHLRLAWSNLYYSCDVCNNRKANHPTVAEADEESRFVDPCAEDPDDHFRLIREPKSGDFCRVTHLSDPAEYTIRQLQFNRRPFLRDFWRELDTAERRWNENLRGVTEILKQIGDSNSEAQSLRDQCNDEIARIRECRPFPLSEDRGA